MNMQVQKDKETKEQRESLFRIKLVPDADIEPGHQWLVLPYTEQSISLCVLLMGTFQPAFHDGQICVAHTAEVDERLVALIDQLAHVRFSAPGLVQLTLTAAPVAAEEPEPDPGLEGA